MIFVTVGTHEQQFNRLIKTVDGLAEQKLLDEPVFMQIGYSTYIPHSCQWSKFLAYDEMSRMMSEASVVITHGGPSTFIEAMAAGKVPIVVPRKLDYDEHVNNHQVEFIAQITQRFTGILPCYEEGDLLEAIGQCRTMRSTSAFSNNSRFCDSLLEMIEAL